MRLILSTVVLCSISALAQTAAGKAPPPPATSAAPAANKTPAPPPAKATAGPAPATAAGPKLDGAKLYLERTCVACHGKDAKTPILPNYPKLAGQNAAYAEQQMRDIKSGARSNAQTAAMKGIMPLVADEEIPVLAEYISKLK
jgi:cytochrome c